MNGMTTLFAIARPAYRFSRVTRFTDLDTYLGGTTAVSPVGASGTIRVGAKRPSIHKYTVGIQRELGWNVVADVAYVGEFTRHLYDQFNHNPVPAGARFDPANRDLTQTPSAAGKSSCQGSTTTTSRFSKTSRCHVTIASRVTAARNERRMVFSLRYTF